MELNQSLSSTLKTTMEQTLSPQLLKSLSILTMPVMELENQIALEMNANPVLELEDPEPENESPDLGVEDCDSFVPSQSGLDTANFDENRDDFTENLEKNLESNGFDSSSSSSADDADEKRQFLLDSIQAETSLQSDLLEQLSFTQCPKNLYAAAIYIIVSTGRSGYLETAPADIAQSSGATLDETLEALRLVQTFDPPGIAARDLAECLTLQLERKGMGNSKTAELVKNHLDDLAKNRLPKIAAEMNISLDELSELINEIKKLNPHPGLLLDTGKEAYVEPDVTLLRDGDEYKVEYNRNASPRLMLAKRYLDMLSDPSTDDETRKYIREKILSAKQLMHNLDQRKSTIERIAELIVSAQYDFFKLGKSALKPMTMKEIAEKLGVNETTVSRAVSGKYMATPKGLLKMRDFFTSGFSSETGDDVSNSSVKEMIRDLVSKENPEKPLSDSKLESMLAKQGLTVARRTVAKYREELGIGSSQMRKIYK